MRRGLSSSLPLAAGAALFALLAVLATLQYRWIGQGSLLESRRLRDALQMAGAGFAEDFDREVARAFVAFLPPAGPEPDLAARLARQRARWLAEAAYPRLLREVFRVRRAAGAPPVLEVLRLAPPRLVAVPWPPELAPLARRLAADAPGTGPGPAASSGPGALSPVVADAPALLVAAAHRPPPDPGDRLLPPGEPPDAADRILLWLDRDVLARELFPELTRRRFGSREGVEDAVAVLAGEGAAPALFVSDPRLPASAFRAADLSVPLFALRRSDTLSAGRPARPAPLPRAPRGGAWRLAIRRRGGSLAEAVAAYRRRNLAVSAGILGLLALSTVSLMATTQRARRLARQQMEFVAAVSHELHTPVAAILAAGQNLADGVVSEPAQVARYGALIEREGRRLSGMVEKVLDVAGIQSGRRAYELKATAVEPVVAGALDDCRRLLAERQAEVETDVAAGLPPVQGDPSALRLALRNLIENAAKYGGPAPWIGVRARPAGGEVEIVVEDRGMGLDGEDTGRLFEPFFRGREAVARSIAGSGLGLAVVRHVVSAHRGRVSVATGGAGRGSAFTLHLPVAPAAEQP